MLIFIGVKMLGENFFEIGDALELGVIALILTVSVLASILFPKKAEPENDA